jgi:hypothetical protein
MKNIENYLDDLKEMTGSDYQSAIALKVDRSVISKMRSRSAISDENAVKLAELIGVDAGEVLVAAALARSKGAVKDAWRSVGKRAGIGNGSEENVYYVKYFAYAVWLDFCRRRTSYGGAPFVFMGFERDQPGRMARRTLSAWRAGLSR